MCSARHPPDDWAPGRTLMRDVASGRGPGILTPHCLRESQTTTDPTSDPGGHRATPRPPGPPRPLPVRRPWKTGPEGDEPSTTLSVPDGPSRRGPVGSVPEIRRSPMCQHRSKTGQLPTRCQMSSIQPASTPMAAASAEALRRVSRLGRSHRLRRLRWRPPDADSDLVVQVGGNLAMKPSLVMSASQERCRRAGRDVR